MKRKTILAMCVLSMTVFWGSYVPVMAEDNKAKAEAESTVETADEKENQEKGENVLEDGVYSADFDTDSTMFHVNESCDGKGTLTVKDGKMTIHVSLVSKSIQNLFVGKAENAQKESAEILEPTTDSVTYSDGYTEEVYGFDIPVPALDKEFDVALIGKKGKWYDHKVSVSNPVPTVLEGGSGKASVENPVSITVKNGSVTAKIVWSSPNYDYMLVAGKKYTMTNTEGNSTFEIPVAEFDSKLEVTADTVAMSTPHEIDYTLQFDSSTIQEAE